MAFRVRAVRAHRRPSLVCVARVRPTVALGVNSGHMTLSRPIPNPMVRATTALSIHRLVYDSRRPRLIILSLRPCFSCSTLFTFLIGPSLPPLSRQLPPSAASNHRARITQNHQNGGLPRAGCSCSPQGLSPRTVLAIVDCFMLCSEGPNSLLLVSSFVLLP
jgi:hypothetical protein